MLLQSSQVTVVRYAVAIIAAATYAVAIINAITIVTAYCLLLDMLPMAVPTAGCLSLAMLLRSSHLTVVRYAIHGNNYTWLYVASYAAEVIFFFSFVRWKFQSPR